MSFLDGNSTLLTSSVRIPCALDGKALVNKWLCAAALWENWCAWNCSLLSQTKLHVPRGSGQELAHTSLQHGHVLHSMLIVCMDIVGPDS